MANASLKLLMRVFYDSHYDQTAIEEDPKGVVKSLFRESQLSNHLRFGEVKLQNAAKTPYDVSSDIEVIVHSIANRAWPTLWLTHLAATITKQFWLSTQDSAIYSSNQRTAIHSDIRVADLALGSFLHPNAFYSYYNSGSTRRCKARFEYDSKRFYVFFEYGDDVGRLELLWNRDIATDIIVSKHQEPVDIYFLLLLPPRVSKALPLQVGNKTVLPDIGNIDGDRYQFNMTRITEFPTCSTDIIGGSNCMRLRIHKANAGSPGASDILSRLQSLGFRVNFTNVTEKIEPTTKDKEIFESSQRYLESFAELWAFQVLLSKGLLVSETMAHDTSILKDMALREDPIRLEEALYQIADVVETRRFIDVGKALNFFMSAGYKKSEIPLLQLKKVRRVIVTPTRCIFYPPHLMFDNRILREYDPDFCLRVSFRDDDMQKLSNVREEDRFYRRTIERRLEDGIHLKDRHFEFLACSNSQIRDHGVWFYAKDDDGNYAERIRELMGDLSGIDCVATYVSRMGQCFSTSEDSITVRVDGEKVKTDGEDVKRYGFTFSDGTGRISRSLAEQVSEETGRKGVNSVYQIRYGGCKGTVSLDPTLDGDSLIIRKSMRKFESNHQRLEVVKVSNPCSLYLNHQSIMLMDQLGVPNSVFLRLQEDMLQELVDMFIYEPKAADALGKRTATGIKYRKLVESGIQLTFDPLFRQMLHAVMGMHMREIRDRARIELPSDYGRNMIGAMDETNTLRYNEVFVQYSKNIRQPEAPSEVLKGDVIVTKFPALHQGDIRRFKAVDAPKLHHMVDCIVFPSQGPRPHPNEMAGSDLDGDEYFVTWFPDFLDRFPKHSEEAMKYPSPVKNKLGRPVELSDIIRFVAEYIQNDRLGQIASAHKVHADSEEAGIFSKVCQILAAKHSEAVDFAKTGICPDLDESERPKSYPDFMGKQGRGTVYRSKRTLGEMYRVSRNIGNLLSLGDGERSRYSSLPVNENLIHRGHGLYLHAARETHERYRNTIRELIERYGIKSEAELVSGCIKSLNLRISQRDEKFETIQLLKVQMEGVTKQFRSTFFEEFGGEQESHTREPTEKVMAKASAWYMASYDPDSNGALSFPWIVWDVLRHISLANMPPTSQDLKPSISKITTAIHDGYMRMREETSGTCIQQFPLVSDWDWFIPIILSRNLGLIPLVQFLLRWAEDEDVASQGRKQNLLSFQEFTLLLLQFAVNKKFLSPSNVAGSPKLLHSIISAEKNMSEELFDDVHGERSNVTIGEIMMEFLKFSSSIALQQYEAFEIFGKPLGVQYFQRLSVKALRAYYCLAVTGDVQELVSGSLETQPQEISVIIRSSVWMDIRDYCPSIESALRELFGEGLTQVTLRRHRAGKYQSGILWAVGNHSIVLRLEDLWDVFSTRISRRPDTTDMRKKEDFLTYFSHLLKTVAY